MNLYKIDIVSCDDDGKLNARNKLNVTANQIGRMLEKLCDETPEILTEPAIYSAFQRYFAFQRSFAFQRYFAIEPTLFEHVIGSEVELLDRILSVPVYKLECSTTNEPELLGRLAEGIRSIAIGSRLSVSACADASRALISMARDLETMADTLNSRTASRLESVPKLTAQQADIVANLVTSAVACSLDTSVEAKCQTIRRRLAMMTEPKR